MAAASVMTPKLLRPGLTDPHQSEVCLFSLDLLRKAAERWKKARAVQADPEGGVQNNEGWVSVTRTPSPPILCVRGSISCTESGPSCFSVATPFAKARSSAERSPGVRFPLSRFNFFLCSYFFDLLKIFVSRTKVSHRARQSNELIYQH